MLPNLYLGATSKNIVDAIIEISMRHEIEIGLIASRSQSDFNHSYIGMKTVDLYDYVRKRADFVYLCRDHGGPVSTQIEDDSKTSFTTDARCMDVIHIDPWKIAADLEDGIKKTIEYITFCYKKNKNVLFEIGTEEAIYPYTPVELRGILSELEKNLSVDIFNNILFACIQGGVGLDLFNKKNTGMFNEKKFIDFVSVCNDYGIIPKEHNGDYLNVDDLQYRFSNGLGAINIAPEIPTVESQFIWNDLLNKSSYEDINSWYNLTLNQAPWQKWVDENTDVTKLDKEQFVVAFGHYVFDVPAFKYIKRKNNVDEHAIVYELKEKITNLLDCIYEKNNNV